MARSRILCLALGACLALCQIAAAQVVLLDFMSDRCPPCRAMTPIVRQLATQRYDVREVNLTYEPGAAAQYKVSVTPTFLAMVDGKEYGRLEGRATYAQLEELIQTAAARAGQNRANVRAQSPGELMAIDMQSPAAPAGAGAQTFAAGPAPGRVVPIQEPAPPRPSAASRGGAPSSSLAAPAPAAAEAPPSGLAAQLIEATVRLSIEDPDGRSTGTGVIVDARNGEALVLTCGHLFRSSNGKGRIKITRFSAASGSVRATETTTGVLMHYDLNRDLALVRFSPSSAPGVAPVASQGTPLEPGAAVTTVGCNHGDDPTAWSSRITKINRYEGFPNVEAAGAPIEGRSGGGLFNDRGHLIGICYAADPNADEGLYASLTSIQAKLDELQLSMVYQSPSVGQPASDPARGPAQLASASADQFAVRGQDPGAAAGGAEDDRWPAADWPAAARNEPAPAAATASAPSPASVPAASAGLAPQEQAALEELARRGASAEIICIIRPLTPEGHSDVVKLNNVSPAFVRALAGQAASAPGAGAAAGGFAPTAAAPGHVLR